MEKQGEKVHEHILSNAPLNSLSIGPIKPMQKTNTKRLNKTGVVLPAELLAKDCDKSHIVHLFELNLALL